MFRPTQAPVTYRAAARQNAANGELDPIKPTTAAGELVGFYAHSFQDGDEEMGEREFMMIGVSLPGRVVIDSGIRLVVLVPFRELEVTAILEAKVFPARREDGVVS